VGRIHRAAPRRVSLFPLLRAVPNLGIAAVGDDAADKACRDNRSVLYLRVPKLFTDLTLARGDGRYTRILRSLAGVQLLILDDWGLEPLDAGARHDLYEILEDRYSRRSTILTSQIPVDKWHAVIGNPTYADAILDRLVHKRLPHRSRRRQPASTALDPSQPGGQLTVPGSVT
jgi:hypothetical protein